MELECMGFYPFYFVFMRKRSFTLNKRYFLIVPPNKAMLDQSRNIIYKLQ